MKEENLIKLFQVEDDHKAFETLVLRYQDQIFNLSYRFLNDYHEAEDAAQEIFLRIYRGLKSFKGQSSFTTWLYQVASNLLKNKVSAVSYRFKRLTSFLERPVKDEAFSPEKSFEKKEKERIIEREIKKLPPDQRTLIILRDLSDLSYEEIATIEGLKLGTVKSKINRGRTTLKKRLGRLLKDER